MMRAKSKAECVFRMAVDSMLPHAEFGPNDHREDSPTLVATSIEIIYL